MYARGTSIYFPRGHRMETRTKEVGMGMFPQETTVKQAYIKISSVSFPTGTVKNSNPQ